MMLASVQWHKMMRCVKGKSWVFFFPYIFPNEKLLEVNFVGWNANQKIHRKGFWCARRVRIAEEEKEGRLKGAADPCAIARLRCPAVAVHTPHCWTPMSGCWGRHGRDIPVLVLTLPGWCRGFGFLGAFAFKGHWCTFSLRLQKQKRDHFVFSSIYAIGTPGCREAGRFPSLSLSFWGTRFTFWAVMARKVSCF